jgi:hypothetical protein
MIKGKQGGFTDIFLFLILTIVIVFICGIFIYFGSIANTKIHEVVDPMNLGPENSTQIVNESIGAVNTSYQALYWISVMLIVGMILSIFIGSYLVTTKPVFFIPYIFILIIAIFVSVGLELAYEQVIADATLGSTFAGFIGANFLISRLPILVTVIGIVGGIIMFVRMGSRENVLYGGQYG